MALLFILLCWKDSVQDYVYVDSYTSIEKVVEASKGKDCRIDEITMYEP
jgi:hypothetical protein